MPPIAKVDSTQPVLPKTIEPVASKVEVGAAATMKELGILRGAWLAEAP